MKAKVNKRFRDKETKRVYNVGPKSIFEGKQSRVEELQKLGFLGEKVKEEPSLLDGNVSQVTESITSELEKDKLQELLKEEKDKDNRKGVIKHIESLLTE